jgi:PAS domain S-box-containing protein
LAALLPPLTAFAIERTFSTTVPRTLLFNAAVIVSSWIGGLKAGVVATILSTALLYSLMEGSATPGGEARLYVTAVLFLAVGVAISLFHARLTRVRGELEATNRNLQRTTIDLEQSKALLQTVVDNSPNALVVKNLQGEYILTNHQFERTFGLSADELRDRTDFDILPREDAERHAALDSRAIAAGEAVTAEETGHLRGMVLHFIETIFPLRDAAGNTFGVAWIGTEISDIKRAEQALEHTAADLKEAQRVARIGSWRWDAATGNVEWSEELFHIYGLDPTRPAPRFEDQLDTLVTRESAQVLSAAHDKVKLGGDPFELDIEFIHADRSHRWASVRGEPVNDAAGRVVGIRGTVQDVTQLKHLQRMKEEWMSVIAHDLRQPIGVIKMSAELLPDLHRGGITPQEGETTARIRAAANRLARMVDDLLDMSRIEAHRLSLERSWVDPRAVVRESIASLSHVTDDCPVHVNDSGHVSRVYVDLVRFEQIFGNLISNAVKHGDKGAPIDVGVSQHGPDVRISVTNHGKGIAPEDVPKLFSRFGRPTDSRGPAAPGLGLGLYIAKGLVEAHGGRMWVESVPGDRTTFHFTLPGREPAKEAA